MNQDPQPQSVADLEAAYGRPSQAGFGSAVFHEPMSATEDLGQLALERYRYFVGGLWDRYGAEAWMGPWREVHVRASGAQGDILGELRAIGDADAARSVPMILDDIEGADRARAALTAVYDDTAITELRVYNLGDGGAMSGLLIAGRRTAQGDSTVLVFLLD